MPSLSVAQVTLYTLRRIPGKGPSILFVTSFKDVVAQGQGPLHPLRADMCKKGVGVGMMVVAVCDDVAVLVVVVGVV